MTEQRRGMSAAALSICFKRREEISSRDIHKLRTKQMLIRSFSSRYDKRPKTSNQSQITGSLIQFLNPTKPHNSDSQSPTSFGAKRKPKHHSRALPIMHPATTAGIHLPPLRIMHPQPPTQSNTRTYLPSPLDSIRTTSTLSSLPSHSLPPLPQFLLPSSTEHPLPSFPMHESHLPNHITTHSPAPSLRIPFNTPSQRNTNTPHISFQTHSLPQTSQPSSHLQIPDIRNIHPIHTSNPLTFHSASSYPMFRQAHVSRPSPAMRPHPQPPQSQVIHQYQEHSSNTPNLVDVRNIPNPSVPMQTHNYAKPIYSQQVYDQVVSSPVATGIRPLPPGPPPGLPHSPLMPQRPLQQSPIQQSLIQQRPVHRQPVQPLPPQTVQQVTQSPIQGPLRVQPSPTRLSPVQKEAPMLPSTTVSVPPAPTPRDAAAEQYWRRLHALLNSAKEFAKELQPNRTILTRPEEIPRQIAYDLQGLPAHAADAHAAKQSQQYNSAYAALAAGDFVEYGVTSAHATWAAAILSEIMGTPSPWGLIDAPIVGTCPDKSVEDVRIRLFEAEVSCLPMEYVEELLKKRRAMRKFKHRIDLCVRILLALEGRGRRPAQATLDRVKLQLEKADMQARAEAEREAARKEKERIKNDRVKKTVVKTEDHKKRKRQQSAQANFMMRFVKKDEKAETEEEEVVVVETRKGFAVPLAKDRDVMCVSWWLRAEMKNISLDKLDHPLEGQHNEDVTVKEMVQHLSLCAERRESAEHRIHVVLREYRQQRKMHTENRTPMFAARRADVRGRGVTGPVKLLQFAENHRPAFFGTFSRRSKLISGRRPFGKDCELDYECDSADEWDEDEEGEDLLDCEADKELASEEAELRRLYGSDDEEDDDFLDDADLDDDDDEDGDRDENGNGSGTASQEGPAAPKPDGSGTDVVDLTLVTVKDSKGENKRPAKDDTRKRSGKRRKGMLKQSVVTYGVSVPDGEPSPLDRFAVNAFDGSQPIQMFNPFVYTSSDIVAEHLKAKPPSSRVVRASNLDESTKLDLAAALMKTGSTKDKIVLQFCEHRKLRGLAVPTKADINRAIGEIAIKEKRNGDTRALWHLTDQAIAKKVAEMNIPTVAPFSRPSPSVAVD